MSNQMHQGETREMKMAMMRDHARARGTHLPRTRMQTTGNPVTPLGRRYAPPNRTRLCSHHAAHSLIAKGGEKITGSTQRNTGGTPNGVRHAAA